MWETSEYVNDENYCYFIWLKRFLDTTFSEKKSLCSKERVNFPKYRYKFKINRYKLVNDLSIEVNKLQINWNYLELYCT